MGLYKIVSTPYTKVKSGRSIREQETLEPVVQSGRDDTSSNKRTCAKSGLSAGISCGVFDRDRAGRVGD